MTPPYELYTFPFACSFAVKLLLRLHDQPVTERRVERGAARRVATEALAAVNPKRKVPTLVDAEGAVHTEIVAVLHSLDTALVPRTEAGRRAHLEWLCFVATELHQQVLGPTFDPATPAVTIDDAGSRLLPPVLAQVEAALAGDGRLSDEPLPSGAETYLFWALSLVRNRWPAAVATPSIRTFMAWMTTHDVVRHQLRAEAEALVA